MSDRLSTRTRELAAARIGLAIAKSDITVDQAARIVAESDCQHWDRIDDTERDYYRTCASNLLERISDPPHGIGMIKNDLWTLC